jgi:hypothetical protein
MKNKLMPMMDKLLTRNRSIIETIIDQLKNISQIEHSRHLLPRQTKKGSRIERLPAKGDGVNH